MQERKGRAAASHQMDYCTQSHGRGSVQDAGSDACRRSHVHMQAILGVIDYGVREGDLEDG